MRVLLIEDDELNRDMLKRRLQRAGHEVVVAEDGLVGVERAHLEQPDIILMDVTLPGLNGYDATGQLKSHPETWTIPVVALTGHAHDEERTRALDAGCDDFHRKPIDLPELLAVMTRLCEGRGSKRNS